MKEKLLHKNFIKINEDQFDFNKLSLFLDRYNLNSRIRSNFIDEYILQSIFQVRGVGATPEFKPIYDYLQEKLNPHNVKNDLDIFFSLTSGTSSITHRDPYKVHILNFKGKIIYKLDAGIFELDPGDLLIIPPEMTHKAIGLTPRIVLSYAHY
jgi:hypothetical protein|tara:strand:- start:1103 stop:1561 length:459 start_codon:yes stop_codon:yes gene_type:complete